VHAGVLKLAHRYVTELYKLKNAQLIVDQLAYDAREYEDINPVIGKQLAQQKSIIPVFEKSLEDALQKWRDSDCPKKDAQPNINDCK